MNQKRLDGLDIFRGFAIVLMIIYHFTYDLVDFGFLELKMNSNLSILLFRYTIISMFLVTVGISLALVHQKAINYISLKKRIFILTISALLVSLSTYILFPQHWIYFGILHFILVASVISLPLLKHPTLTLILVVFIFIGWFMDYLHFSFLYQLLQEPLNLPLYFSLDRIPIFPWWAVVLLGVLLVQHNLHEKLFRLQWFDSTTKSKQILKKMGQHALLIYLIHQPIILLGFQTYFILFSK